MGVWGWWVVPHPAPRSSITPLVALARTEPNYFRFCHTKSQFCCFSFLGGGRHNLILHILVKSTNLDNVCNNDLVEFKIFWTSTDQGCEKRQRYETFARQGLLTNEQWRRGRMNNKIYTYAHLHRMKRKPASLELIEQFLGRRKRSEAARHVWQQIQVGQILNVGL